MRGKVLATNHLLASCRRLRLDELRCLDDDGGSSPRVQLGRGNRTSNGFPSVIPLYNNSFYDKLSIDPSVDI